MAARLLWAASLFDAAFLFLCLQFLRKLVIALLDEAGIGLSGFRNRELDQAASFIVGAFTFLTLLLIYWIVCEYILGGKTLGRQCLMLELRDTTGRRAKKSQLRRRALSKISTFGLNGLSLRDADPRDTRNDLSWWSPMAAAQASLWRDWSIHIESGTYSGNSHALDRLKNFSTSRSIQIGRNTDWADVALDRDGQVSNRHAILKYENGQWTLEDCGSSNKTFLGREEVPAGQSRRLPPDGRFRVANVQLRLGL